MNDIVRGIRRKYPEYNDLTDDQLTLAAGTKDPSLLQDADFRADFERVTGGSETPGKLATLGREAVAGVVPSAAAGGGAVAAGALAGTLGAGPIGTALGALAGGFVGGLIGDKTQSAVLDEYAPEFQEARRAGAEANPWSAMGGTVISAAPSFVVSPGSALSKLGKVARGVATRSEALEAMAPIALGTVTGAGVPVILEGRAPTMPEIVGGAAQAVIFGEPRFGAKGRAAAAAAEKLTPENIAKDDAETRAVVGKKEPASEIPPPDSASATEAAAAARQQELVKAADFWASMDTADPRVEQLVRDNFNLNDAEMAVVRADLGVAIQRVKARSIAQEERDASYEAARQRMMPEARGDKGEWSARDYESELSRVSPDEENMGRLMVGPPRGETDIVLSSSRAVSPEGEVVPRQPGPFPQTDETAIPIIERQRVARAQLPDAPVSRMPELQPPVADTTPTARGGLMEGISPEQEAMRAARGIVPPAELPVGVKIPKKNALSKLWERFDGSDENMTARDLANEVEALENIPSSVRKPLAKYRAAMKEDFEQMAGRGDVEPFENAFVDAVKRASKTGDVVPSGKSANPTRPTVDTSAILSAPDQETALTVAGKMIREATTEIDLAAIQKAIKARNNEATSSRTNPVAAAEAEVAKPVSNKTPEWEQMPSVTPGGKQHFYTLKNPSGNGYFKVVWNRKQGKWQAKSPHDITLGEFASDSDGRLFVNDVVKKQISQSGQSQKPSLTIPKDASFARIQTPDGGDMVVSAKDIPTLLKDGAVNPATDTITFGNKRAKGGEFVPLEAPTPKATDATRAAIADAKARVKKAVEKSQRMGATADPKEIAKTQAEFYHALYDLATNYIKLGVQTAAEFAKQIGMELNAALQRAFDDAKTGKRNPPSAVETSVPESLRSGTTRQHAVAENVSKGRAEAGEQVRAAVAEMPDYWQSSNSLKRQAAQAMTPEELVAVPSGDAMYFPAKAELAKRLDRDGKHEQANAAWRALAEEARAMGQQTAYLKELYSDPFYYIQRISRSLMEAGFDPLTVEKKTALKTLADAAKKAEAEYDAATEKFAKNKTDENYRAAEKAQKASEEADLALQSKTAAMLPRSAWGTLKAILQGNLIAPISQVANVTGNVTFTPFRSAARGASTVVDYLDAFLTGRNRQLSALTPAEAAGNLIKATPEAAKKAVSIAKEGSGRTVKGEERQGLHPVEAWRDMALHAAEAPTVNGKLTMGQKADIWLQRTFGMTAEPMLRTLAAMDVMAREPAWRNIVSREAKVRVVDGKTFPMTATEAAQAVKFPEVFFAPDVVKRMRADADAAVFQRESQTIRMINSWMHKQGPFADFAYATIAPYKLTPWNIIGEIFSYNPVVATATMFGHGAKSRVIAAKAAKNKALGNEREAGAQQALADTHRRNAKIAAGKMVVGSIMSGAAWYLYKKGILSPSYDASDEAIKTRIQAGDILPPNHLNISALGRLLDGGDAMPKKGDTTVDVFRAGGLAGAFMYMAANIGRDMERSRDVDGEKILWSLAQDSTLEMGRYGINQSFLKGVAGVLEAFREGRADQVVSNWINGVISIPLPNTLAAVSRATRPYKPDTKADGFSQKFANAVANRLGGAMGMDSYMPLKRDVWGRPMEETPAGRNAFAYHMADVFKFQQASDSPLDMEVYRLARKTGSTEAIPSIPKPELAIRGKLYTLDRNEFSQLAAHVGEERRRVAELMVTNPNFHTAQDAVKLRLLQRAYDVGERIGRAKFMRELGKPTNLKPAREGFTPS